jgi:recombination protein RecA
MTIDSEENRVPSVALTETIDRLQHRFGRSQHASPAGLTGGRLRVIPTGWPTLDRALGIGGLPVGHIVDVFGPSGSGKTTLALRVIAQTQRQGGTAVFIDTESGLSPSYARAWGIDPERLWLAQPATAEEALAMMLALVQAGLTTVVLDSVAGLVPAGEDAGDGGRSGGSQLTRLLCHGWRRLIGPLQRGNSLLLVTNQLRITSTGETVSGGVVLRHYASVRLELRPGPLLRQEGAIIGRRIRATIRKNRLAPPFRTAEFDLVPGGE